MKSDQLRKTLRSEVEACLRTIEGKNGSYNPDEDKLSSFKMVANLMGVTPVEAAFSLMSKHVVSVWQIFKDSSIIFDKEFCDEKIRDHICYLLLLQALLSDTREELSGETFSQCQCPKLDETTKTAKINAELDLHEERLKCFGLTPSEGMKVAVQSNNEVYVTYIYRNGNWEVYRD